MYGTSALISCIKFNIGVHASKRMIHTRSSLHILIEHDNALAGNSNFTHKAYIISKKVANYTKT